ncbi:MAG: hypothetical protein SOI43_02325 [Olsenella sp.]|jgi:hypothetical protein
MDLFDYSEKIDSVTNGLRGAGWILVNMAQPEDADEMATADFISDGLNRYADILEEISTGLHDMYRSDSHTAEGRSDTDGLEDSHHNNEA